MIVELLRPEKIVMELTGEIPQALEKLFTRTSFPDRIEDFRRAVGSGDTPYSCLGNGVAIPHVRIDGLPRPELLLGVAPRGMAMNGEQISLLVFLATPADRTEEHLQMLQRLSSLLPAIKEEIIAQHDAKDALKIIARAEQKAGKSTYLNLAQEQVAFELRTDLSNGLTTIEARRRLERYGLNRLQKPRRTPWYLKLLKNLFSFFAILLWIAALLCFLPAVAMPELGFAIFAVVLLNGLFAFFQEQKSDRALEALEKFVAQRARAVRDGCDHEIDAAELVPGDVIFLDEGDVVPADARLVEAYEVEVDNASLTGESNPARRYKSDRPVLIEGQFLWIELPNIVFAGTSLVRGHARAVVIGTGMHSELGQIAGMTQGIQAEQSPLQKQLRGTVFAISGLAGALGLVFLLLAWLVAGLSFFEALVFFIGLFVANVPEGLLPTVTLSLAMAVTRMAKRHALVKSLPSVETLGCTTVICCDKTGTLTQNVMMVAALYVDGKRVDVSGAGYRPEGEFRVEGRRLAPEEISGWSPLRRLFECASICNNAKIEKSGTDYRVIGEPTEGALVTLAEKAGMRGTHQRIHLNPFESIRKRMSVVVNVDGEQVAYIKGAPLETLACCDFVLADGAPVPLTEEERRRIRAENDAMAERGLRVLAFAYRNDAELKGLSDYEVEQVERRLVFIGLAAMSDPIRLEVAPAIRACHAAGIRIMMVTGDYALTAASIGEQIGLGQGGPLGTHTGAELSDMDDERLRAVLARGEPIFARVAPEHKLRIVSLLREMGEIVAVTGDGVNDAPALKRADIGIAMGIRGNDVAKEAAHMILADDNFGSIVAAIEEGRAVFDNIRRFMAYIFNHNPLEMYPYIVWLLFPDVPLAMTVMGVLAVDVGTDLIPAMGLGVEPPEPGIMERPPRPREQKLLSMGFILRNYFVQGTVVTLSCYATYLYLGWVLGYWRPGLGLGAMPQPPQGLQLSEASREYLQTLTAYFFPAVTTQLANVHCQRSWKTSLFSHEFLQPGYRRELLQAISAWTPKAYPADTRLQYRLSAGKPSEATRVFFLPVANLLLLPVKLLFVIGSQAIAALERPLVAATSRLAGFLERHYIVMNFISNPLIVLGIVFEIVLCYVFFYTPLAKIYFFAPVPWHVYVFAFHGTALLFLLEEIKKYYRRRGYPLEFLG
ncbi:MAG TPA: HAD-IC family P-type ATPase [Verrucomicrobiae bacterium]|jgi:magnesium-transporting ATPase (P-type)|nr:HAD-IC family P-type ATPase [Verrucomicrobiae bacterium]